MTFSGVPRAPDCHVEYTLCRPQLAWPSYTFSCYCSLSILEILFSLFLIQMSPTSIPACLVLFSISFCSSEFPFPHPLWMFLHSRLSSLGCIPTLVMFFLHSRCYVHIYVNHSQITVSSLDYTFQLHIHLNVPQKPEIEPSRMPAPPLTTPTQIYFSYTSHPSEENHHLPKFSNLRIKQHIL